MRISRLLLISLAFAASCRGDGVAPLRKPGIVIVAGDVGDTIQARPVQALVVQVNRDDGMPASGEIVRFQPIFSQSNAAYVLVAPLASAQFQTFVADTADNTGRAAVVLLMGTVAGEAQIEVTVPTLGFGDTVSISVAPGAAVRAQFSIHDTTLKTGATYALSAKQADRFNNLRAESVPIVDKTPAVCTWANDKVTTTSMGRCVLTSSFAQTTDSTTASVVPNARFAVVGGGAVGLISSDGTNYRKVIGIVDYSVSPGWSPDGSKVVIYEGDPYSYSSISVVDTLGNRLAQVGKDISFFYSAMFGRFSPDGQWVYFSGRQTVNDAVTGIWRMAPNGTNIQSVLSSSQTFPFSVAQHVNFSPNGAKLAFDIGSQIAVLDIATNQPTLLGVSGVTPSYSPDGQQIAFYGTSYYPSALKVMNADGSNVRTLSNGDFGIWQTAQWTPDGAWLLVQPSSAGLMYVNVADGSTLPLSYGAPYGQPAVRPN